MIKTYKNKQGKQVGALIDGVYTKNVQRAKHLMKMFNGYGIDADIFYDLEKTGCTSIKIKEMDTGKMLECAFPLFAEKKILKEFDGPQFFIQGKYLQNE